MKDFTYYNPVKVVFGSNAIDELKNVIPAEGTIMLVAGGGSIKKNGVYDKVMAGLAGRDVVEHWGIEPNPEYENCMKAAALAKEKDVSFFLSVGGGSVLDATKFIAVATVYGEGDPWEIMEGKEVDKALPLGCVLTLPATGSEVNGNSVISRRSAGKKMAFSTTKVMPVFSLLDPSTTLTLSPRQTTNGIVDAFVHVMEQYLTYDVDTPLQDRQAEGILSTLVEVGPKLMANPDDLGLRANLMWAASNALSTLINCGTVQDWSTHIIGHEITALHGLDHAQTLAIILPGVMEHQRKQKGGKIVQYGKRVWGLEGSDDEIIDAAIAKTAAFFEEVGNPTTFGAYDLTYEQVQPAAKALGDRGWEIGEHQDIKQPEIEAILKLRV